MRGFKCPTITKVFPNLQQKLILGMSWLIQKDPNIDWVAWTVRVMRHRVIHNLPTIRQAIGGATDKLEANGNYISVKAFKRAIRKGRIKGDIVFLGLIQKVQEPIEQVDVAKKYKGKSDLGAIHVWREDMLECIKAILKEYSDIFPQDLPSGLPPVKMGHAFKVDLEDDTPPIHRPLYKLSSLELEEAHKQTQYMLEHGFIRPSDSPYGAPVLFTLKKDSSLRFCIDCLWLNKRQSGIGTLCHYRKRCWTVLVAPRCSAKLI